MDKVLQITGSTGFVGQNLINYLKSVDGFHFLLTTRQQLAQPEINDDVYAVIHLAGKAHDLKVSKDPNEYYDVNFELTKKLYDRFLQSKADKFIFISSVKAAADHVEGTLTENYAANPTTDYGRSKLMAENYIKSKVLPAGKSYYILRPCMIHGPGNKGNLNLLYQVIKKGIPYPLGAFDNKRSFLSIENLCFVIKELLIQTDIAPGIYNVSDDKPISTKELVKLISTQLGLRAKLWNVNAKLIKMLARAGDWLMFPLNTDKLNKLTENYVVENHKIKNALRKDLPVETVEGIIRTINSFSAC